MGVGACRRRQCPIRPCPGARAPCNGVVADTALRRIRMDEVPVGPEGTMSRIFWIRLGMQFAVGSGGPPGARTNPVPQESNVHVGQAERLLRHHFRMRARNSRHDEASIGMARNDEWSTVRLRRGKGERSVAQIQGARRRCTMVAPQAVAFEDWLYLVGEQAACVSGRQLLARRDAACCGRENNARSNDGSNSAGHLMSR